MQRKTNRLKKFWCQFIHMISGISIWYDNHAYGVIGGYAVAFPDRGDAWHFIAMLLDTLLELFYRRRESTFDIFISKPHTVPIMFISAEYGGHCMWWKADSISMPHSSTNMKVWVVYCHPGTQKSTEVYEIYTELTGEVLAHDIHIVFLVYGSKNLQQMTKMNFSSLLFVLEFMVRNITAFYSGCWYIATQSVLPLPL